MAHRDLTLKLPTLALIAATRGMLGAGIGLLLAGKLSDSKRQIVGRTLLTVGIASTIPLAMKVFRRRWERDEFERVTDAGFDMETGREPVF